MNTNSEIVGNVKLQSGIESIPDKGLTTSKLRVELFEESKAELAWISELNVMGDLPWFEGEERQVEIRIMSDEFRDHVVKKHPSLLVRYGSQVIGRLELD